MKTVITTVACSKRYKMPCCRRDNRAMRPI